MRRRRETEGQTRNFRNGSSPMIAKGEGRGLTAVGIEAPPASGSVQEEWEGTQRGTPRHAEFAMHWNGVTVAHQRSDVLSALSILLGFPYIVVQTLPILGDNIVSATSTTSSDDTARTWDALRDELE